LAFAVVMCALGAGPAAANCLVIPIPEIQALDRERERNPEHAIALSEARLRGLAAAHDALARAHLHLIVAFSRGAEGRAADAGAALAAARQEISQLPDGADRHLLELKLRLGAFGAAKTQSEYQRSLAELDRYVAMSTPGTLEWVCLLHARGDLQAELDRPDLAVADQLAAYRAARTHAWKDAQAGLALTLATTYRRSGLWSDAEAMINEVMDYATQEDLTWLLALAKFTSGQIFVNERQWDKAFAELEISQRLATQVGDSLTAGFATLPMCDALINSHQIDKAEAQCGTAFDTFFTLGRSDLVTDSMIYRARIDQLKRRYVSALAILNDVLNHRLDDVPSRYKPRLYRERAEALSALGRDREAILDWKSSAAAADFVAQADRHRTVAVLAGIAKAQGFEETSQALEQENRLQRERLTKQKAVRDLSVSLAVAGLFACVVLAYLLYLGRRYRHVLARHAAVLSTLTDNLADTVMLLDPQQRLQFANRSLREGSTIAAGSPIESVVPAEAGEQFRQAIEDVIHSRQSKNFEAGWSGPAGDPQIYEQLATPVIVGDQLVGVTLRATDVTVRRAMDLRSQLQARVLDTMNEGVLAVDESGRITLANVAMCTLLERTVQELIGKPVDALACNPGAGLRRSASGPTAACILHAEACLLRRDGSECLVAYAGSELTFGHQTMVIYVCRDISAQRRIERTLATEASRKARWVGDRLHEGLAQDLAGVSLLMAAKARQPRGGWELPDKKNDDIEVHLTNAIGTARELAQMVSPVSAASGSLRVALQSLTEATGRQRGIPTQCVVDLESAGIDAATSDQVYRIAQNAVQYASRDPSCAAIGLFLDGASAHIRLSISWEYNPGDTRSSRSSEPELEYIGYRTRLLGGTYGLDESVPDRGLIAVSIPRVA
jgi:PAS domain S-box-containing protein